MWCKTAVRLLCLCSTCDNKPPCCSDRPEVPCLALNLLCDQYQGFSCGCCDHYGRIVSSSSKRDLNTGHMKGSVQGRLHSSTWLKWVGSIHVTVNIADIVNISPVPTANCWLQTMFQHHVCKQYTQQISGGKSILTDVCFLAGVGGRSRGAAPQRGSVLCPHSAGQHHSRHAHMEVKLRAVLPGFK